MLRRAIFYSAFLVIAYSFALAYFEQRSNILDDVREIGLAALPVCVLSVAALAVRFMRWRWLLRRCGSEVQTTRGAIAYLAGFALTASPGKVGELIRIRYFRTLGVPAEHVVACLIIERASDVIALLLLSSFIAGATGFWFGCGFALLTIAAVVAMLRLEPIWRMAADWLHRAGWRTLAWYAQIAGRGIGASAPFFRPLELAVSLAFGVIIYGVLSISFVYLAYALGLSLPTSKALGVYPLGTLIGAASFLPGGLGTTEVAMIFLLRQLAVPFDVAGVASLTMRLASTWLAIALGLISAAFLELRAQRTDVNPRRTVEGSDLP